MTRALKFLMHGARGRFSQFQWPRPDVGQGEWVDAGTVVADCAYGVHACRVGDLPDWIDDELWVVELAGGILERESMLIAHRGRLVARVEAWGSDAQRAYAEACVWRYRDAAVAHLRRSGSSGEADVLAAAPDLAAIQSYARDVAVATGDDVVAFAADAVSLLAGDRPDRWRDGSGGGVPQAPSATAANLGFVVAHAIAQIPNADSYERAFAEERDWQVRWLVARLGLTVQ